MIECFLIVINIKICYNTVMKDISNTLKKIAVSATTNSSKIEKISFSRAKKNTSVIKKLQTHGRAFSL